MIFGVRKLLHQNIIIHLSISLVWSVAIYFFSVNFPNWEKISKLENLPKTTKNIYNMCDSNLNTHWNSHRCYEIHVLSWVSTYVTYVSRLEYLRYVSNDNDSLQIWPNQASTWWLCSYERGVWPLYRPNHTNTKLQLMALQLWKRCVCDCFTDHAKLQPMALQCDERTV